MRLPTRRIWSAYGGTEAHGGSNFATVFTADSRRAFFVSYADNLVPGDTNNHMNVFERDLRTGRVRLVNVTADGTPSSGREIYSVGVDVSASGRTAVFSSSASDLVPDNPNMYRGVFAYLRGIGGRLMW